MGLYPYQNHAYPQFSLVPIVPIECGAAIVSNTPKVVWIS
uniref:Uncharacterized protein n=1 Tax=Pseudomonas syringae pv. actinidiae TaxID=103796 RepID=A0A2P0QIQ4_PSESF|nr:hypothetical protein [Pseudomonas syringae pv. actinidiae]